MRGRSSRTPVTRSTSTSRWTSSSLRKRPEWRAIAEGVIFRSGDITENADAAEEGAEVGGDEGGSSDGSLGIGDLRSAS